MGNDSGTRPATPASPAHTAIQNEALLRAASGPSRLEAQSDEEAGAYVGIEDIFRRKLAALRRLRPADRPHALRAARDERLLALRGLKERRAFARQAERLLRRARAPAPR